MTAITDVNIGQRFSFQVYPTAIIGNTFTDVIMEGIISADVARAYGIDVDSLHANVYPTLPAGVPNDPRQYSWVMVRQANGERTVLGVPWIRQETIVLSTGRTLTLTFQDRTQVSYDRIMLQLSAVGEKPDLVNWN